MSSFTRKGLRFTLTLGSGTFSNKGSTLQISELQAEVTYEAIISSLPQVEVDLYGMASSDMDQLTVLSSLISTTDRVNNNLLFIESASDADLGNWTQIFAGTIYEAYPDFSGFPNVKFHIAAAGGYLTKLQPLSSTPIKGNVDVEAMGQSIIDKMQTPYKLVSKLKTPRTIAQSFSTEGDGIAQLKQLGKSAGVYFTVENDRIYLVDKDATNTTSSDEPFLISAATGMIGFPSYTKQGLVVRYLFDANAISLFRQFQVQSLLTYANGIWWPVKISHHLCTHADFPSWESTFLGTSPGT